MKKEKEKARNAKNKIDAKIPKNAPEPESSSRSSQSNANQQSAGVRQTGSSELHVAVPTMSNTPAVVTIPPAIPSTTLLPDSIILQAGCWTHFWLFLCCVSSAQYTNGHH
jgi:hypothetical protein